MGKSNRQPPIARQNAPTLSHTPIANNTRFRIKSNGRANVAGHAEETIPHRKPPCIFGLNDQVLFAVGKSRRVRQVWKLNARRWIFRGDGFVTQIEAKAVHAWFANHPSQHESSHKEIQIGKIFCIAKIPQHTRSWTALVRIVLRVNRKSRRAAGYNPGHGETGGNQFAAENVNSRESRCAQLSSFCEIW